MQKIISELMDFPEKTSFALLKQEFIHKYGASWVLVNDTPELIEGVSNDYLKVFGKLFKTDQITSIKVFYPKIGIYQYGDCYFYLGKANKKQWTKGFAINKTHYIKYLNMHMEVNLRDIMSSTYHGELCIADSSLFYRYIKIGTIYDSTIFQNILTENEIKDLWKIHPLLPNITTLKFQSQQNFPLTQKSKKVFGDIVF